MLNFEAVKAGDVVATMKTTMGQIKIKLFPSVAPRAVENFVQKAKSGYYEGIIFHRVINDFMIQGGDPTGTGCGGESIWGNSFEDEFSIEALNFRGALSMANAGPNTNGSQFFIVQAKMVDSRLLAQMEPAGYPQEIIEKYAQIGGTPHLDFRHTVFGQVIEGMEVVDAIAEVEVDGRDKPLTDVVIQKIEIENI